MRCRRGGWASWLVVLTLGAIAGGCSSGPNAATAVDGGADVASDGPAAQDATANGDDAGAVDAGSVDAGEDASDGGPSDSGATDGGSDAGTARGSHVALTAGASVMHSSSYTFVGTLGQGPGTNAGMSSPSFQLRGGLVGATQTK